MLILIKRWKKLEKRVADLERQVQGQQVMIKAIKKILQESGVSQNYFLNFQDGYTQSERHP